MDDSVIEYEIETELAWDPLLNPEELGVTVLDGAVTLTGYVSTFAEKKAAVRAAERVEGVRVVADEIDVRRNDPALPQDPEIAGAIAKAFRQNTDVPDTITAEVRDGWVTLRGEAASNHQRLEAERTVDDAAGVTGVTNVVSVTPTAGASSDVERRVSDALKRGAQLDAGSIRVSNQNGIVTLHGHVHSFRERRAAEEAAWGPGVTRVRNRIKVRP